MSLGTGIRTEVRMHPSHHQTILRNAHVSYYVLQPLPKPYFLDTKSSAKQPKWISTKSTGPASVRIREVTAVAMLLQGIKKGISRKVERYFLQESFTLFSSRMNLGKGIFLLMLFLLDFKSCCWNSLKYSYTMDQRMRKQRPLRYIERKPWRAAGTSGALFLCTTVKILDLLQATLHALVAYLERLSMHYFVVIFYVTVALTTTANLYAQVHLRFVKSGFVPYVATSHG